MIISDLNHYEELVNAPKIEGGSNYLNSIFSYANSLLVDLGKNLKVGNGSKILGKKGSKFSKIDKKLVSQAKGSSAVVTTSQSYYIS